MQHSPIGPQCNGGKLEEVEDFKCIFIHFLFIVSLFVWNNVRDPRSPVKLSTTEPLLSLFIVC